MLGQQFVAHRIDVRALVTDVEKISRRARKNASRTSGF
jgi:hypothetical protein